MTGPSKAPRHLAVLDYIVQFKREHDGLSPSMREMAEALNTSTSVISYYLNLLRVTGLIEFLDGTKARSIMVIGGEWRLLARQEKSHEHSSG